MTQGPDTPPPPEPDQPAGQQPPAPPPPGQPAQPGQPAYGDPQGGYGQAPPPAGYRPGQPPMRPDEEKIWAIGAHLGPLVLGFIAPLVVWLVFKDRSAFLDRTGKEALNMQLSYLIYFVVAFITLFLLIGLLLLPLVGLAWLVLMIVATIKVANFEDYRYPVIFRFIK
jgi:uncharacterized protein